MAPEARSCNDISGRTGAAISIGLAWRPCRQAGVLFGHVRNQVPDVYRRDMARGYMEGPAAEEAERRAEELARGITDEPADFETAVYGCTEDDPAPHFLGLLGEVDPDELFASGAAWGVTVRRVAAT